MSTAATDRPAPFSTNPVGVVFRDVTTELRARVPYPPGPAGIHLRTTMRFTSDPLPLLLAFYERYGPVFSFRVLHQRQVFMLGPEANQFITVTHPELFRWRDGHFGELTPLLGDGLLTTDTAYHDRARSILMPAFHREHIEASVEIMVDETTRAMAAWQPGDVVDVYDWTRVLALRIAMRALLGLEPGHEGESLAAARHFEHALAFYGIDAPRRMVRGPGSPLHRLRRARRRLDAIVYDEIARRRVTPHEGATDILSSLVEARDDAGRPFTDREIRDQVVTLLFAGHDTSTSTIAFLLYELARHPAELAVLHDEQDRVLQGGPPSAAQMHADLPALDMAVDETLRLYPPAWVGARYAVEDFEFHGSSVPAGAYVNYSSWASHRLPHVFPDPDAFIPARFARERKAALPRGAYVPFGAGSRICIGKRFGQLMVKTISTLLLQRYRLDLADPGPLRIALLPTIGPRDGLRVVVRER
jgi:cytochrome P450